MPHNAPLAAYRTGPVARSSLSLACNDCRFHGLHSRVNGPGLPLRDPLAASLVRSELVRQPACSARTRRPATSPRCLRYSPRRLLAVPDRCSESRRTSVTGEAGVSKRPFAPPGRLPVSGPPLRHRRSWPASLTPCQLQPLARSAANSLPRTRFPVAGKISACSPLPRRAWHSGWLSGPRSPSGPFDPSGSTLGPVRPRKLAFAYRPMPFAPRWSKL
jgi:hypothetical protein